MISSNNPDYRSLFEIKDVTRMTSEPSFETLTSLLDQLKINAQAIPSVLGGGNHGHLGLVVPHAEYQHLSLTPFVQPNNPGQFVINQQMTMLSPEQINQLRLQHSARLALYNQVKQVESALKQFISETVPHQYLLELRHNVTKKLNGTIPQIMRQLFTRYGNITAQSLVEKQTTLINYNYDPEKPIDVIYQLAKDFQDYSSAYGSPLPEAAIITIVYNILRKTGRFNNALQKWNERRMDQR